MAKKYILALIPNLTIIREATSFSRPIIPTISRTYKNTPNTSCCGTQYRRTSLSTTSNDSIQKNSDEYSFIPINVTLESASNKTNKLEIQNGEILRTAMLRRGVSPHNGRARLINCRGLGTCGTCAVEIIHDKNSESCNSFLEPMERNTKERIRLNFPPHGGVNQSPNLRLACQVQVKDDIIVRKRTGFWGQDSSSEEFLAEEYKAELWFGELEFILDDKSPPKN